MIKYNVYRSTVSGSAYVRINASPIAPIDPGPGVIGYRYSDSMLSSGTDYYYRVTGVDATGTESQVSYEDSDAPNPSGVPWDTDDPVAIMNQVNANGSQFVAAWQSIYSSSLEMGAFGPNSVYYSNNGSTCTSTSANDHWNSNGNAWNPEGGTYSPTLDPVTQSMQGYGPTSPPTGPYRKVEGAVGNLSMSGDVVFGQASGMHYDIGAQSCACVYSGGVVNRRHIDAGFIKGLDTTPGWSLIINHRADGEAKLKSEFLPVANDVWAIGSVHLSFIVPNNIGK